MVVDTFYENVEGPDGKNQVLQFTPRNREPMLVACLWSHWAEPTGKLRIWTVSRPSPTSQSQKSQLLAMTARSSTSSLST